MIGVVRCHARIFILSHRVSLNRTLIAREFSAIQQVDSLSLFAPFGTDRPWHSNKKTEEEFMGGTVDLDPVETSEWVDSLRGVLHHQGSARATYLLERLTDEAQ